MLSICRMLQRPARWQQQRWQHVFSKQRAAQRRCRREATQSRYAMRVHRCKSLSICKLCVQSYACVEGRVWCRQEDSSQAQCSRYTNTMTMVQFSFSIQFRVVDHAGRSHAQALVHAVAAAAQPPPPSGLVLGIESSCDDTGVAVMTPDGQILGQVLLAPHSSPLLCSSEPFCLNSSCEVSAAMHALGARGKTCVTLTLQLPSIMHYAALLLQARNVVVHSGSLPGCAW